MNVSNLSGKLARNAIVGGTGDKVLLFTLATKYGFNTIEKKDRTAYVPCVLFNPAPELELLLSQKGKGVYIECEGRVSSSSYEVDGERKFKTEVIVRNGTLSVVQS